MRVLNSALITNKNILNFHLAPLFTLQPHPVELFIISATSLFTSIPPMSNAILSVDKASNKFVGKLKKIFHNSYFCLKIPTS